MRRVLVVAVVAVVAVACASPEIRERCRYVTEHTRAPELPPELAPVDRLILTRMRRRTGEVRDLNRSLSVPFEENYAKEFLPEYCGQLDLARTLAAGGKVHQAARVYQGLLLASQVIELGIAVMRIANHADETGQPGGQIDRILEVFAAQTQPLLDAAASRDPERIRRAQEAASPLFTAWVAYAEAWSLRVERGEEQAKTAKHVWDAIMLSAAAWEAAAGLAAIAAKGPPGGPFPMAGGAAVATAVPSVELVEALRKLIAIGALDAAVVASLGKLASPPVAGAAVPLPDPSLPIISQMGDLKVPPNMAKVKKINGRYPINAEYAGGKYPLENLRADLRSKYPNSVRFTEDGHPDFRPYAVKEVQVKGLEGNSKRDFTRADEAAGITKEYRSANRLVWHHHQDCKTMQLVPQDIHEAVRHTGGTALLGGGPAN